MKGNSKLVTPQCKRLMDTRGFDSIREIARKSGVPLSVVHRIMTGNTQHKELLAYIHLASTLGLPLDQFATLLFLDSNQIGVLQSRSSSGTIDIKKRSFLSSIDGESASLGLL